MKSTHILNQKLFARSSLLCFVIPCKCRMQLFYIYLPSKIFFSPFKINKNHFFSKISGLLKHHLSPLDSVYSQSLPNRVSNSLICLVYFGLIIFSPILLISPSIHILFSTRLNLFIYLFLFRKYENCYKIPELFREKSLGNNKHKYLESSQDR